MYIFFVNINVWIYQCEHYIYFRITHFSCNILYIIMSIIQNAYTRMYLTSMVFVTTFNESSLNEISLNTFKKLFVDVCTIRYMSINY